MDLDLKRPGRIESTIGVTYQLGPMTARALRTRTATRELGAGHHGGGPEERGLSAEYARFDVKPELRPFPRITVEDVFQLLIPSRF